MYLNQVPNIVSYSVVYSILLNDAINYDDGAQRNCGYFWFSSSLDLIFVPNL